MFITSREFSIYVSSVPDEYDVLQPTYGIRRILPDGREHIIKDISAELDEVVLLCNNLEGSDILESQFKDIVDDYIDYIS